MAFGGGCHWCTEAVFQALKGVEKVEQGYVASVAGNSSFSEAVIVHFDEDVIKVEVLMEIHLLTHNSASNHAMRTKYRSAIYIFSEAQKFEVNLALNRIKANASEKIITSVLEFSAFEPSREAIQNYYQKNPSKPFCERYIAPKLKMLQQQFSEVYQIRTIK
ncbi:peptide-methionine (S)-S-oxide reductase [Subsaximicrobium wynnwilliamsii]|uniref:peptide-methionine (S)-S-oxide reductase n=1 Tax=Subsaximicrobium wynnwilliamsii TaxID=291179 RepID=UPI0029394EDA|nr:peptide-methionine (S)-S-oxide reductase [Subsaximicrobium wynnwilliamsii]